MKEVVDPKLRDQQAGFRRNRSCADQIASLRIIVEQSLESTPPPLPPNPLYISFIDYEKAFDSVDRETMWKLLRLRTWAAGLPTSASCLEVSRWGLEFVRGACFHLSSSSWSSTGSWRPLQQVGTTVCSEHWTQLDDLDFAEDLALLSHNHSQMQDKTTLLETTSAGTGLRINRKKTQLMRMNTTANTPGTVGGEPIREVESFVYLESVIDQQGGTDRDVTAWIGKARAAFIMLKKKTTTSEHLEELAWEPNSASSTPMWSQSCSTGVKNGGRHRRWNKRCKHSSTPVWGTSTKSNGRRSKMTICRSERDRNQWPSRYCRGSGAESDTPSGSQHPALHAKPWPGTRRGRGSNSWRRDTEVELKQQRTNWSGMATAAQNRV